MLHLELHVMTEEDLNEVLSQFIVEERKDQGIRYPPKTLHELMSSLQKYIELKGRKVNFFSGIEFEKLRKSLDVEMKCSAKSNLGLNRKQAEVISVEIEKLLWEQGILGSENPECLLRTVFYLIGLNYGMRAGDEHRRLSLTNFSFHSDSMGRYYLFYSEGVSKTNQGGLKHRKLSRRHYKAYANVESRDRCVVHIVKTYIGRCHEEGMIKGFYLRPLEKFKDKSIWFSAMPLGHNKMNSMVKCMMSKAGVKGYFTNHFLRATTVSRLFQEGVDKKLIRGVTGHRSEALNSYK
jgi:hypothetical protein